MIRFDSTATPIRPAAVLLAVAAALALAACQKKDAAVVAPAPAASAGAPAATVNGQPISEQQLQFAMHQRRGFRPDTPEVARATLDELIDHELEKQQAEKLKLDQQAQVQETIEALRREILAREYLKSISEKVAKPTDAEIRKYFDDHPAMYAQRQTYSLKRMEVTAPEDKRDAVVEKAGAVKTVAELDAWLKAQGYKVESSPLSVTSEQLQGPVGEKLRAIKPGQALAQKGGNGVMIFELESLTPAPKTLEQARPQIVQVLSAEAHRTVVNGAAKDLRKDAKVEYASRYAQAPASGASAGPVPLGASAPASAGSR